jgi:cytochrome P450
MKLTSQEIQTAMIEAQALRNEKGSRNSMMDSFLDRGLTNEDALVELGVVIAAGTDNFATATQGIILCIITNPAVYQKLQREIDGADVGTSTVTKQTARSLPYMNACILEGLRLMPPDTQLRERMVAPEGDTIGGYFVPGGTFIGFNSLAAQRNKDIYGEDADVFRPERWLDEDKSKVQNMYKTLELLFSYGSSKCLGYEMTFAEMEKIVFGVSAMSSCVSR